MITTDRLIGWLCILRHNLDESCKGAFFLPSCVKTALVARGWVEVSKGEDGEWLHVLPEGCFRSDLEAAEWGIDPIGSVKESK